MTEKPSDNRDAPAGDHHIDPDAFVVPYTRHSDAEELANAISHGAACIAAAGTTGYVLATVSMATSRQLGFLAYAASLIFVFFMSTLSHIATRPRLLHSLRSWDQGAIYFLIVGTYTPGIIAFAGRTIGIGLLVAMWSLALLGFASKVIIRHRIHAIDTWTYIALGWLPAMVLATGVTMEYFLWMLAGGMAYTAGVCFLLYDQKIKFFHAIWHVLVIVAAGIHYYAICRLALN